MKRRYALAAAALLVSISLHFGLGVGIGGELERAPTEAITVVRVESATVVEQPPPPPQLRFDAPPLPPQTPLFVDRARIVPPTDVTPTLRAASGGGPSIAAQGQGPGLADPGPAMGLGTGLDAGDGRFARYIGALRETGLDVMFVVDATGSMDWALTEVKLRITDIVDAVRTLVPIARFGIVAYRDVGDPDFVVRAQPLTYSRAKLRRFLDRLNGSGGGDRGEAVLAGVRDAIQSGGWRNDGRRLVLLIGDAPPHRNDEAALHSLIADFRAAGGELTSLDVSDEANPALLEARLGRAVNRALYRSAPSYDFQRMAEIGGGVAATLDGELELTRRLVRLVFGDEHGAEIAPLLVGLEP